MNNNLKLFAFVTVVSLFAGCATTTPVDSNARALCIQKFGTDAHMKVLWLPITNTDRFASAFLGNSRWPLTIASAMDSAKYKRVDLIVWPEPPNGATSTIESALRYIPANDRLYNLNFLFVGNASEANKLRPQIEATGAKFYFQQR